MITTKKPQANMLYLSIPVSGIPIVPEHVWEEHVATSRATGTWTSRSSATGRGS